MYQICAYLHVNFNHICECLHCYQPIVTSTNSTVCEYFHLHHIIKFYNSKNNFQVYMHEHLRINNY